MIEVERVKHMSVEETIKALEQEPCDDAVSRQAVHDLIAELLSDYLHDEDREKIEKLDVKIEDLPPVTLKEKTAEWYEEDGCKGACEGYMSAGVICSQCGEVLCGYIGNYDFCPNCGARMVRE